MAGKSEAVASRSTVDIRSAGNRLRDEPSGYLQQHAHNPLDWYPWGEEALERARKEDLPVFLSIGYASCHWCHVMEHEVFDDDGVAEFMNQHFVCIKVDREERPDLDAAYMEAVQAMTGKGGWPLSVFLTPGLVPIYGGTYLPRPTFLSVAQRLLGVFRDQRGELNEQAVRIRAALEQQLPLEPSGIPDLEALEATGEQALSRMDLRHGGLDSPMKFPMPPLWSFLLHLYRRNGDQRLGKAVRTTLDAIAAGGLQDHLGGGFHRYTVDPGWQVPHFEKMLYDNAQLAQLFGEASAVFGEPQYAQVAGRTLDFMLDEMSEPGGAFFASFDADSGGEEGSYYAWTPAELVSVAGEEDGAVLADLLGVTDQGNFEGKNVLSRRSSAAEVAKRHGREEHEVAALLGRYRPDLLEYRGRRPRPALDKKIITAWNGLAISAMARGYSLLGKLRYKRAAEAAAEFLWSEHRRADGRLSRASTDGHPAGQGVLEDHALLVLGLIDLFDATGETQHLRRALSLLDLTRQRFGRTGGGFFHTAEDVDTPLGRRVELQDGVVPSGGAVMVMALVRAAALTGKSEYWEESAEVLGTMNRLLSRAGLELPTWQDAALLVRGPLYEVVVAGDPAHHDHGDLVSAVRQMLPFNTVLVQVPPEGPDDATQLLLPPTEGKKAIEGHATAYVCQHGSCEAPTSDPEKLRWRILEGWTT